MPTKKPRIAISVSVETKALLDELAEVSGQPASTFITELLEESANALFRPIIDAMRMAKEKKVEAWDVLNAALSKSQYSMAQMSLAIHEEKRKETPEKKAPRRKNAAKV